MLNLNLRQKQILQIAEREGEVAIKVLADKLKVSEMTIYRDVDVLQEQRYLYKKRGAIVYIENDDRATADFYADEKRAIGIKAASLILEEAGGKISQWNGESLPFAEPSTIVAGNVDTYAYLLEILRKR